MATLADSLAVVIDELPESLVPREQRPGLEALAQRLAPVHRCGFEVRLGSSSEVDLQQGITSRGGELRALNDHLQRSAESDERWRALSELIAECNNAESPLHDGVETVWLEFDRPPHAALSVFVGFAQTVSSADRLGLAKAAIELLDPGGWARFGSTVQRCISACPTGASISHAGVMLGRPSRFLRLNVSRLEPGDLGRFLVDSGWPGNPQGPSEIAHELRPLVDALTVCLDAGEQLGARVGFECHLHRQPAQEPRWEALLETLVANGWCAPEKRDALLQWPGVVTPATAHRPWPTDVVRDSLRRPADHFSSLKRQLNHVKVACEPGQATEAKGYFGFLHAWLRPGLERELSNPPAEVRRRNGNTLGAAISAATGFLLASRTREGWWREFAGTEQAHQDWSKVFGWSDEWVSAAIAIALAGTDDGAAEQASQQAWRLLTRRRLPLAGWGHNRRAPVDGDSTAWVLRLAAAVGRSQDLAARAGQRVLRRHQLADGGVVAYMPDVCPRPASKPLTPPNGSIAGWSLIGHACQTANAALLGDAPAREFLRRNQRPDGSWASYWWPDDEYATALGAEALAATRQPGDQARAERAVRWTIDRLSDSGSISESPFATALALRTLKLSQEDGAVHDARHAALAWLVSQQHADGSWTASAWSLAPRPDVIDRTSGSAGPVRCLDVARQFTTATALWALAR
jgi:hypothetical protein